MAPQGPTIAEIALATIGDRGPQSLDALVDVVVSAGRTRARDPNRAVTSALDAYPGLVRGWDDRWYSLAHQLEGAIFTSRPTSLERRNDVLFLRDGMHLVERLAIRRRPFVRHGDVHLDFVGDFFDLPYLEEGEPYGEDTLIDLDIADETAAELTGFLREIGVPYGISDDQMLYEFVVESRYDRLLHGPAGWLPTIRHDGLIGVTLRAGVFDTIALDRRDIRGPHVALAGTRMAALAHRIIGPDPSWFGPAVLELSDLLELIATDAPETLRRPLPPIPEVLERAGLEVVDGLVGHAGTDWDALGYISGLDPASAWGFEPPDRPS